MLIVAAVATALQQYEFEEEKRRASIARPTLSSRASIAPFLPISTGDLSVSLMKRRLDAPSARVLLLSKRSNLPTTESSSQFPTEFRLALRSTATRLSRKTFAGTVPAYARESSEADACVAALERLTTAFETPVDGGNDRKKAKFPPTELFNPGF
ncbi:hypothetical protein FPCIR_5225 [Fusarium pseudocircinatum]|uniref:Uncharacterized protein n=1 Tax=Fusarium pseudocircinatum TaxID=56676 RepID=A0A8H5PBL7_9HYPO|nr:hypothetical protein FPCIR_5225 [Fusarium pseudocircinatum]